METNYLIILLLLLGLLASTVPVFMALFFTGTAGLVFMIGIDPQIVIEVLYRSMDKFALVVVLFFILCGNIMTTGSIVHKLIKTANTLVGFLPGGLATGTGFCQPVAQPPPKMKGTDRMTNIVQTM